MLKAEAEWLGQRLGGIPDEALFPLLDVGSSTLDFRTRIQPYIEQNIFAPLSARGGKVIHLDAKPAPGVDLVCDLMDPRCIDEVLKLNVRSVLISNLLEHVAERGPLCEAIMKLVPSGGYLVVTGPYRYPFHADPIDTMFRPTIEEIHGHFPGTEIIDSAIIDCGNWRELSVTERGGRTVGRTLLRFCLPFYRPDKWKEVASQVPYMIRHIKAFAVILRKT